MSRYAELSDNKKKQNVETWLKEARDCYVDALVDSDDGDEVSSDWNMRRASVAAQIALAMGTEQTLRLSRTTTRKGTGGQL